MKIDRNIYNEFIKIAKPILDNELFISQKKYIQHGKTSVYDHVVIVTLKAFKIAYKKKYDLKAIIKGGLLHDFFLYDWHIKNGHKGLHGFNHPKTALKNANLITTLTEKEENIILSHMWPLTLLTFPKSKEAWLITFFDKYTSILESLRINKGIELC